VGFWEHSSQSATRCLVQLRGVRTDDVSRFGVRRQRSSRTWQVAKRCDFPPQSTQLLPASPARAASTMVPYGSNLQQKHTVFSRADRALLVLSRCRNALTDASKQAFLTTAGHALAKGKGSRQHPSTSTALVSNATGSFRSSWHRQSWSRERLPQRLIGACRAAPRSRGPRAATRRCRRAEWMGLAGAGEGTSLLAIRCP
jgi:hypothetical protein